MFSQFLQYLFRLLIYLSKRCGLILFGLLLVLFLLEAALQSIGVFINALHERRNRKDLFGVNQYRILCLGGSTTYNGADWSYPSQLERLLDASGLDCRFRVINKGLPGRDSASILGILEKCLDEYRPHFVIGLIGNNDGFNFIPYSQPPVSKETIGKQLVTGVSGGEKIKIFRLFRISHERIRSFCVGKGWLSPPPSFPVSDTGFDWSQSESSTPTRKKSNELSFAADGYSANEKLEQAQALYSEAVRIDPSNPLPYIGLANILAKVSAYDFSVQLAQLASQLSPSTPAVWQSLVCLIPRDNFAKRPLRFAALKKILAHCPDSIEAHMRLFEGLERDMAGNRDKIDDLLENIRKRNLANDRLWGFAAVYALQQGKKDIADGYFRKLRWFLMNYYRPNLRENYSRIIAAVRARNIGFVCVQDPMLPVEALEKLLDYRPDVVYVDNEEPFRALVSANGYEKYFYDRFGGAFGHATTLGNHLLAVNVAKAILRKFFGRDLPADVIARAAEAANTRR